MTAYLFIVYKATSELDTILPLIWKLRLERADAKIVVVYAVINRKMILRESTFYTSLFEEWGVEQHDLAALPHRWPAAVRNGLHEVFGRNYWDGVSYIGKSNIGRRWALKLVKALDALFLRFVSWGRLLQRFAPDHVFMALRAYSFPGKQRLFDAIEEYGRPTWLYPHGTICSTGFDLIEFGRKYQERLPAFCRYWYCFSQEVTVKRYPVISNQSYCFGYPGLDSAWLAYLRSQFPRPAASASAGELRCMFLIRKFTEHRREYAVMSFDEFNAILNATLKGLRDCGRPVRLIIKPHPQNDYKQLDQLLRETGCRDYEISHEPIYHAITRADFAVSVTSTSLIIPAVFRVPLIHVRSTIKDEFESWPPMKEVYGGGSFVADTAEEIPALIREVVMLLSGPAVERDGLLRKEADHFRALFPDGAAERIIAAMDKERR